MVMANVTIVSAMRDSLPELPAFMTRFYALDYPPAQLRLIVVEGDSVDGTPAALREWADKEKRLRVVTCNMGRPHYGSVIDDDRFRVLGTVFNAGMDAVDTRWSSHVMFIPSDVRHEPGLLSRLMAHDLDLVAPFFWTSSGMMFYDTWGFSRGGVHFGNFMRTELPAYGDAPIQMDTIGGCILMRADVLRAGVRYSLEDVDQGLCRAAIAHGFTVWADPTTHIQHG